MLIADRRKHGAPLVPRERTDTHGGSIKPLFRIFSPILRSGPNFATRARDATKEPCLHSSRLSLSTYHKARSRKVVRPKGGAVATQLQIATVRDAVCACRVSKRQDQSRDRIRPLRAPRSYFHCCTADNSTSMC